MFVVIQEVEIKRPSKGNSKSLEVYESRFTMNGREYCYYRYQKSNECFERPIKKAYRISARESFRKNGKVQQKQVSICTIGYYNVIDWGYWIDDYVKGGLKSKADVLGLTEEELIDMIYEKWQPVVDRIKAEYKQTEEYRVTKEYDHIIKVWSERREAFAKKYGISQDEFDKCYDVYCTLRNPEYLEKIKSDYKARKEYEKQSREYQRSYYDNFNTNYNNDGGSSCGGIFSNNYTHEEKDILKQFYRALSKKYHPDANPDMDTSKQMQLLNRLKSDLGVQLPHHKTQ